MGRMKFLVNKFMKSRNKKLKWMVAGIAVFIVLVVTVIILDCAHGEFGYTVNYIIGNSSSNDTVSAKNSDVVKVDNIKESKTPEKTKKPKATPTVKPTKEPTKKPEPTKRPDNDKVAYLTFDDGPSDNTPKILKILEKNKIKATFFVIHNNEYKDVYKKISDAGHTIALHSYSHEYGVIYKSEKAFYDDRQKLVDYLEPMKLETFDSNIFRFPGGSSNTVSRHYSKGIMAKLAKSSEKKGYMYYDWNVSSSDASGNRVAKDKIIKNTLKEAKMSRRDAYILMHDASAKTTTVEALQSVIDGLKKQGFRFDRITEDTQVCHHSNINN